MQFKPDLGKELMFPEILYIARLSVGWMTR